MSTNHETKLRVLKIREILKSTPHLSNPSMPELSFRPDFMIDFENLLTFLEISSLRANENVDWKTLRLIEEIFEVKLFFGDKSVFCLIVLDKKAWKTYCLELLEGFFDKVIYGPIQSASDVYSMPKEMNFRLWNLEREFNASRYRKVTDNEVDQFGFEPTSELQMEQAFAQKLLIEVLYLTAARANEIAARGSPSDTTTRPCGEEIGWRQDLYEKDGETVNVLVLRLRTLKHKEPQHRSIALPIHPKYEPWTWEGRLAQQEPGQMLRKRPRQQVILGRCGLVTPPFFWEKNKADNLRKPFLLSMKSQRF